MVRVDKSYFWLFGFVARWMAIFPPTLLHKMFILLNTDIYSQKDKILIHKSESTGSTFVHLQKLNIEWNIGDIDLAVCVIVNFCSIPSQSLYNIKQCCLVIMVSKWGKKLSSVLTTVPEQIYRANATMIYVKRNSLRCLFSTNQYRLLRVRSKHFECFCLITMSSN